MFSSTQPSDNKDLQDAYLKTLETIFPPQCFGRLWLRGTMVVHITDRKRSSSLQPTTLKYPWARHWTPKPPLLLWHPYINICEWSEIHILVHFVVYFQGFREGTTQISVVYFRSEVCPLISRQKYVFFPLLMREKSQRECVTNQSRHNVSIEAVLKVSIATFLSAIFFPPIWLWNCRFLFVSTLSAPNNSDWKDCCNRKLHHQPCVLLQMLYMLYWSASRCVFDVFDRQLTGD